MIRKTAFLAMALVLAAAILAAGETGAAEEEGNLAAKVDEMNRTLREIAGYMQQHLRGQQTDQLMKRIELRRRALAPLESEVRNSRGAVLSMEMDLKRLETQREFVEEERERAGQSGFPADGNQFEVEERMMKLRIQEILAQKESLESRVFELENDLAGRQAELATWEEILDEELGLR